MSMAQGSGPRPAAAETSAARSASMAPAMGASTIGCSIPNKSMRRRSGHMSAPLNFRLLVLQIRDLEGPDKPAMGESQHCSSRVRKPVDAERRDRQVGFPAGHELCED